MFLDTTTKSLEVLLGGAATANHCPWTASFMEVSSDNSTSAPKNSDGATNGTSAQTVIVAPADSLVRQLRDFSLFNADTVSSTVTVRLNDNGTTRIVSKTTLLSGEHLLYDTQRGWYSTDQNGATKVASTLGAPIVEARTRTAGIILDRTTKSLEVVLAGAITANQLPYVASFMELSNDSRTAAPTNSDGVTNSTTAVTPIVAPAVGLARLLSSFSLYNADTAVATATVRLNDNGTTRIICKQLLAVGDTLAFDAAEGWYVQNASGNRKIAVSASCTEASLTLYDVTTDDVTISKHGFVPKPPNDATKFLSGTAVYSKPPGTGALVPSSGTGAASLPTGLDQTGWSIVNGAIWDDFLTGTIGVYIKDGGAAVNWRGVAKLLSDWIGVATTYTIYAQVFTVCPVGVNSILPGGIYLYDGTKLEGYELMSQTAAVGAYNRLRIEKITNVTTDGSTAFGPTADLVGNLYSAKIVEDGVHRTWYHWANGAWVQDLQETTGTHLTPTKVMIGGLSVANSIIMYAYTELRYINVTTP